MTQASYLYITCCTLFPPQTRKYASIPSKSRNKPPMSLVQLHPSNGNWDCGRTANVPWALYLPYSLLCSPQISHIYYFFLSPKKLHKRAHQKYISVIGVPQFTVTSPSSACSCCCYIIDITSTTSRLVEMSSSQKKWRQYPRQRDTVNAWARSAAHHHRHHCLCSSSSSLCSY